ncbi:MAG: glycosyltransferase [Romboutsia sp.]
MKHIVYLNNYMLEELFEVRKNQEIYSQAANNKIGAIRKSLEINSCEVKIISSGLVNNNSLRIFKTINSSKDRNLIYSGIVDLSFFNILTSIFFSFKEVNRINREKQIDNIIFYNYKPEVAWVAWLSKKILKIPITIEYEDGYYSTQAISKIKKYIFTFTEKIVSKNVDSAILVTSKLKGRVNVKSIVVRGVVDNDFIGGSSLKKYNNSKIKIVYSGGIDRERGIEVLLNSLNYIEDDFELIITGRGNLEDLVRSNKDNRINFLGFVDYKKVKEVIQNADILINCQLENHNFGDASFPSKIFEYMATGNRIISSKVSDIECFAKECFYFYSNDNSKELASAIKQAIYDVKHNIDRYGNNTKNLCKNNTCESVGKKIIEIL